MDCSTGPDSRAARPQAHTCLMADQDFVREEPILPSLFPLINPFTPLIQFPTVSFAFIAFHSLSCFPFLYYPVVRGSSERCKFHKRGSGQISGRSSISVTFCTLKLHLVASKYGFLEKQNVIIEKFKWS